VYAQSYKDDSGLKLLQKAGVEREYMNQN